MFVPRKRQAFQISYDALLNLCSFQINKSKAISALSSIQLKELLEKNATTLTDQSIEHNYITFFDPSLPNSSGASNKQTEQFLRRIKKMEDSFLSNAINKLEEGRFHKLSLKEEEYAFRNSHEFTAPINIKWSTFDKNLLQDVNIYDLDKPKSSDHVLIFHRGVGLHGIRGFFISDKINEGIRRFKYYFSSRAANITNRATSNIAQQKQRAKKKIQTIIQKQPRVRKLVSTVFKSGENTMDNIKSNEEKISDDLISTAEKQRLCIKNLPFDLGKFFNKIYLQEPTFKEVVFIYRDTNPQVPTVLKTDSVSVSFEDKLTSGNYKNICIRYFRDVPMADLNVLFPFQNTTLKSSDRISFFLTTSMLLASISPLLQFPFSSLAASKAWILAVFGSAALFARLSSRMIMTYSYYSTLTEASTGKRIYAKDLAALKLIEIEAIEQIKKEKCLVFMVLYESESSMTELQINFSCRQFLNVICYEHITFDSSKALKELLNQGLIQLHLESGSKLKSYSVRKNADLI
eukprot:maker-scaffold_12-snap-gene-3.15-mRNA-1 protein AED:0.00 eAED:0.00 QI:149/1/1/1/1/1/2/205/518